MSAPPGRNWVGTPLASALLALTPGSEGSGGRLSPMPSPVRGQENTASGVPGAVRGLRVQGENVRRAERGRAGGLDIFSSCLKGPVYGTDKESTGIYFPRQGLPVGPHPTVSSVPGVTSGRQRLRWGLLSVMPPLGTRGAASFMAKTLTQLPPRAFFSAKSVVPRPAAECVGGGWDTFSVWSSVNRMGSHTKK